MKTKIPQKTQHIAIRTCVVCRKQDDKRVLRRIVNTGQGVVVDATGKMNGRGAYLCEDTTCWRRAVSGDILNKALRTVLTREDRDRLLQAMP